MGFVELLVVALIPVLKTLVVTAVGLLLALDKVSILTDTARHHLNNLVFFVFTPALVAGSLADTITMSSLIRLWFMPVNILLTFMIGSALGWMLVKITKTPPHLHGLIIGCCAGGNLGNLLLIIIPAVCQEPNSPFGDSSTCSTDGQAYASLSMAIGAVFLWTYVYNIMRACSLARINSSTISYISTTTSSQCSTMTLESRLEEALLCKDYAHDDQEIHQVVLQDSMQSSICSAHEDEDDKVVPFHKKARRRLKAFAAKCNLKMLFAPSTIATIVGLVIGATSPLRRVLVGDEAPLRVIDTAASMLGSAAIPSMTLIIGANLLKGLKKSEVGKWVIIGVQMVRYVAMPLLGIGIIKGAQKMGLVGSDSLYQYVLLQQYALPSAMTIGTISQLFEVGESDCSVIMLWNYAVAAFALTLWSTCYMWLVS